MRATGTILINSTLMFTPKAVLEYVVAHELMHVKVRSHGPEFWAHMATLIPDYARSAGWLDSNQCSLDAEVLTARAACRWGDVTSASA
jgi:predicted metal-dependent hydrolase